MKFFTNKSIWSKIVIVLVFIIIFEFIASKPSLGAIDPLEFGGTLVSPIVSLVVAASDALMEMFHSQLMGAPQALIEANTASDWWEMFCKTVSFLLYAAVAIAAFIAGGFTVAVAALVGTWYVKTLFSNAFATGDNGEPIGSTTSFTKDNLPNPIYLPVYSISPEEIFQGKILLFNVNFFGEGKEIKVKREDGGDEDVSDSPIRYYYYLDENGEEVKTSPQDLGQELGSTIGKWYVSLRNIGLVAMMIVLLYIGIRILLSTMASDKAKYKEMLKDWLVGMFLLLFANYIMVFANVIVDKITKLVSSNVEESNYYIQMEDDDDENLSKSIEELGDDFSLMVQESKEEGKNKIIIWPTNLMGSLRLRTQLSNWGTEYIGFAICFIILVLLTTFFIFTYMKRVLYMAFLTLIAPLVAVTYPIDKITDGKAQGFDKWLKEYIFNLLIQPMHLLLYYILVSSALELSSTNIVYSLVAISFMVPAEKILRSFFGFEKSATAPSLAVGMGTTMALGSLLKPKPPKGALGKGGQGENSSDDNKGRIKMPTTPGNNEAVLANSFRGSESPQQSSGSNTPNRETRNANIQSDVSSPNYSPTGEEESPNVPLLGYTPHDENEGIAEILDEDGNVTGTTTYSDHDEEESPNVPLLGYTPHDENEDSAEILDEDGNEIRTTESIDDENNLAQENLNQQQQKDDSNRQSRKLNPVLKLQEEGFKDKVKRHTAARVAGTKSSIKRALKKAPGTAIRMAGKGMGAALGATVGLAVGAAQGDFNKAITSMSAGGAIGGTIGGKVSGGTANKVDNAMKVSKENPQAEYNKKFYSKQYQELEQAKMMKKQKKKDAEIIKDNFGEEQAGKMLEEGGLYEQLYSNGITNVQDIQTIQQMINDKKVSDVSEGIAAIKAAEEVGKDYKGLNSRKWRDEWATRYKEGHGFTDADAAKAAKGTMDLIKYINETRDSLYGDK